ncbi:protein of unknown function [Xenorhabdus doucetiae]|uniref:Uncharacterized protein n=1 Tax=Xenorhabdus doucetiae TaxID=351671 RepID=A0A068QY87_9GAMM|nr:protein of unknown function [Xenorhabdus doucetiae]
MQIINNILNVYFLIYITIAIFTYVLGYTYQIEFFKKLGI